MPSILSVFMLQLLVFCLLKYNQNTVFVAFLKPEEAYVHCLLYRNAQEVLDESILSNLVQLLPPKFKVSIGIFFLQVVAA